MQKVAFVREKFGYNGGPEQTLCSAASVLGMHCLNTSHKEDTITG